VANLTLNLFEEEEGGCNSLMQRLLQPYSVMTITNTRYKDWEHLPWSAFTIASSAVYLLCSIFFFFILKVPSIREPTDNDKSSSYKGGCNYF
jgi:hypothetical protein